jgi:DMSO/TMAO reductase YedYZ molybdopterin-dependent catalytic subunit
MDRHHQLNKRSKGKYILAMCVLTALIMVEVVSASVISQPWTLTIIGSNGYQVVLNQNDIGNMANLTATGGRIKKAPGTTEGLGNYTGVPINAFCNLVGGLHSGQTLRVTGNDSYTQNFTYAQVNGGFPTYNGTTRAYVNYTKPLTTILAYYFNGANITYALGGPLRFAIVGSDGLYTNSSYWAKHVNKLEILGTPVGGYWIPVNKIDLLAPYIGAVTIVLVGTVTVGVYRKRNQRKKKQ